MAEIAGERDDNDARIALGGFVDNGHGPIGAAVVDEEKFVRTAGEFIQNGERAAKEFRKHGLLVVQRDGHRESETVAHRFALPLE